MVAGPALVLSGGAVAIDPRCQPQQLKAASTQFGPHASGGLAHGSLKSLMSNHVTSGSEYRVPKRAREDDSEPVGSKQLHMGTGPRDVSQLLHQHRINNIRAAEPEPEPQRGAMKLGATSSARTGTAIAQTSIGSSRATDATDAAMPHELAIIARAAAARMLDAVRASDTPSRAETFLLTTTRLQSLRAAHSDS